MQPTDATALQQTVATQIANRRTILGLTQEGFAERLNCAVTYVQRLERGTNLTLTSLVRIANALETTPQALMSRPGR